jgi:uncharacterized protein YidB (DUF937 family)
VFAVAGPSPQNQGSCISNLEHFMGLLDSVIGALGSAQGGLNAGGSGGQPDLMGALSGLLGGNGSAGSGLGDLVARFQQGGMGDVVNSWVSSGANLPISAEQLQSVLGSDMVAGLARQFGMNPGDAAGQLSNVLPQLIDQLTPNGRLPAAGEGGLGDLAGMLGGLLKR